MYINYILIKEKLALQCRLTIDSYSVQDSLKIKELSVVI